MRDPVQALLVLAEEENGQLLLSRKQGDWLVYAAFEGRQALCVDASLATAAEKVLAEIQA